MLIRELLSAIRRGGSTDTVKAFGVGRQNRFLIGARNIVAFQQLVDFFAAVLCVEAFVRKIRREQKRFVARLFDGEAQAAVVAVKNRRKFCWLSRGGENIRSP
jgi:hypothetical protein